MKLNRSAAPFFRLTWSVKDIMLSYLPACCALLCAAVVLHGIRALMLAVFGVLGGVAVEMLWRFSSHRQQNLADFAEMTSPVTGLLCALMLPANCSPWTVFFAVVFAMAAARLPFGGEPGRSPFNASAAGACFAVMTGADLVRRINRASLSPAERDIFDALPRRCFVYLKGYYSIFKTPGPLQNSVSGHISPNMLLRAGADPGLSAGQLLGGGYNGGMGATVGLLIIACGIWLFFRKSLAWQSSLSYCAAVVTVSFLFPWRAVTRPMSAVYDLMTGLVLFTAVFLCGDIFTAPHLTSARVMYGAGCGLLSVILRRHGAVECGEVFALLLMNAVSDPLDRLSWKLRSEGFSMGAALRRLRDRIKKKLHISSSPIDELDELEARQRGEKGDLSGFGKDVRDDGDEKL